MISTTSNRQNEFNKLLLEAIDDTMVSLGESVKHSIYYYLKCKCRLCREEIPQRINDYSSALRQLFGIGATFLEVRIMKSLYEKTGYLVECCEPNDFSLENYIEMVKVSYLLDSEKSVKNSCHTGFWESDASQERQVTT